MTFTEMALRMYPYWIMGVIMILAVYQSKYRNLLRVERQPILKWGVSLIVLTIYRLIIFKLFSSNSMLQHMTSGAMTIPIGATFMVFWEDACHGLPLVILSLSLGRDKLWKRMLTWAAIAVVMVSFGLGHVYQGYMSAALLSLYIPFTFKKGPQIGFGTVMICHSLYDLVTILTIKIFLG